MENLYAMLKKWGLFIFWLIIVCIDVYSDIRGLQTGICSIYLGKYTHAKVTFLESQNPTAFVIAEIFNWLITSFGIFLAMLLIPRRDAKDKEH
jgi:hypothetical protein